MGDSDVCVGDVGAVGQESDGVDHFVLDEVEHAGSGLAQVFVGGDFGKRNVVGNQSTARASRMLEVRVICGEQGIKLILDTK